MRGSKAKLVFATAALCVGLLASLQGNAGGSGSGTVQLTSVGPVFGATEWQFQQSPAIGGASCLSSSISTQGRDAYIVDLRANGFPSTALSVTVTAGSLVPNQINVRYWVAGTCGLIRNDANKPLAAGVYNSGSYAGDFSPARWATISFTTGLNVAFNWSAS